MAKKDLPLSKKGLLLGNHSRENKTKPAIVKPRNGKLKMLNPKEEEAINKNTQKKDNDPLAKGRHRNKKP